MLKIFTNKQLQVDALQKHQIYDNNMYFPYCDQNHVMTNNKVAAI